MTVGVRRRVARARRRIRRARRRLAGHSRQLRRWGLYPLAALIGLGIAWIVITGLIARRDAQQMRDKLDLVQGLVAQGRLMDARHVAAEIPPLAEQAHRLTTGPAWWAAAQLPWLGRPAEIARGALAAGDRVGRDGIPALLHVADELNPARLRTSGHHIDLYALTAAAPRLTAAASTLHAALARLDDLPRSSWLGAVDSGRASLATALHTVTGYVDAGARSARVLPRLLGADGPRRYFVGLQNEAEMRGTGGLPGAFAILVADHGSLRFTHFASDAGLLPATPDHLISTGVRFGRAYAAAYGPADPTRLFVNSNLSPDFPYAAKIWAAMWQRRSGEHVDGAIALDPGVLANLLAATGPVRVPGLRGADALSAGTVVPFTEQQQYALYPDNVERKRVLVRVLRATARAVLSGATPAVDLVRAVSESAKQHRVLVWTADRSAQRGIDRTNYSGTIPRGPGPFAGMVLNNTAAGKLDYYLGRSLTYQSSGCEFPRDVIVTISLTNNAPSSGLPAYVDTRLDHPARPVRAGDNRSLLDYYATVGAQLSSVTVDGRPATASVLTELGHPVYRLDLELPRGVTRTVVLHLIEPAAHHPPRIWYQPGVTPLHVDVESQLCG